MYRDRTLFRLSISFLALIACGCNPDVFVKPLNPSSRTFVLSEDGDSTKVRFGTADWNVSNLIINGKNLLMMAAGGFVTSVGQNGLKEVSIDRFTMYYKESGDRELTVYFRPNFSGSENRVEIVVSNCFEADTVLFIQNRSSGYELERMEWSGRIDKDSPQLKEGWKVSVKNPGPDTLYVPLEVYRGAARQVTFSDDLGFGDFCGNFKVPVPDGTLNNQNEFSFNDKDYVTYSYATKEYPLSKTQTVQKKFPPTNEFSWYYGIFWNIDKYRTDYTMTLRNKRTDSLVEVKGTFTSECPNGEYFIYLEKR